MWVKIAGRNCGKNERGMWEEAWRKRTTQRENMANITYIIYIISILYTCTVVHVLRTGSLNTYFYFYSK
jgi:hypothetical protein